MRGLFLVGTDTGVGKTTVATGILRLARRAGLRLLPYKPVETGCSPIAGDTQRLLAAAEFDGLTATDVCPIQLPEPLAPIVAAHLGHRTISAADLLAHGRDLERRGDSVLVESAGGLLTPFALKITSASLAILFDIDVLIVAANRLGTINHTALTVAEAARRGLRVVGVVLVDVVAQRSPDQPFNAAEIARLTGVTPLGTLRHCATLDPDTVADALARDVNLSALLGGALVAPRPP